MYSAALLIYLVFRQRRPTSNPKPALTIHDLEDSFTRAESTTKDDYTKEVQVIGHVVGGILISFGSVADTICLK